jgi:hypothetical protein
MSSLAAMDSALDAFRNPSRHRKERVAAFPEGMLLVIKAAAGDQPTINAVAEERRVPGGDVQEASRHYLLKLLLRPGAQGLQLLGLNVGAEPRTIKDHKRWLLKWLHPDRNPNDWERRLFLKVSELPNNPEEMSAIVVLPEGATPDRRRDHSRRRMWVPTEKRVRKATTSALVLRFMRPIMAVAVLVTAGVVALTASPVVPESTRAVAEMISAAFANYASGQR